MRNTKKKSHSRRQEEITAWLMLAPNTLGLIAFVLIPIIIAVYISFNEYNALQPMTFIGLANYRALLQDGHFVNSLMRTLQYALMYVPSIVLFAIILSVTINAMLKTPQSIARTFLFFPYCISATISGLVWQFLLNHQRGYINRIIVLLGGQRQPFFGSPNQALASIAVTAFWINIGYNMVIMLAALKDIPQDYYEAASIDGANALQKFFRITLPQLQYAITFILIVTTINSFQVFDQIKIITGGGPNRSTQVTVHYIYEKAFGHYKLGYASAMAFVFFLILFVFSVVQLRTMAKEIE